MYVLSIIISRVASEFEHMKEYNDKVYNTKDQYGS